jgi:hypothetical protein
LIEKELDVKRNKSGEITGARFLYRCEWCSFEFERTVRASRGGKGAQRVSDSVVCPMCRNGLKTWS